LSRSHLDNIFCDGTGDKKTGKFKIESEVLLEAGQQGPLPV
jgi:hypothetical protein